MNARVYDPLVGRFLSPDSIIPNPFDGQSFNRFSYVNNGPLSATDPTGHYCPTSSGITTASPGPQCSGTAQQILGLGSALHSGGHDLCTADMCVYPPPPKWPDTGVGVSLVSIHPGTQLLGILDLGSLGNLLSQTSGASASGGRGDNNAKTTQTQQSTADKQAADKEGENIHGGEKYKVKINRRYLAGDPAVSCYGQCGDEVELFDAETGRLVGAKETANILNSLLGIGSANAAESAYGDPHGHPFVPDKLLPNNAQGVLGGNRIIDPATGQVIMSFPRDWTAYPLPRGGGFVIAPPGWSPAQGLAGVVRVQPMATGSAIRNPIGYYVVYNGMGQPISPYDGRTVPPAETYNAIGAIIPPTNGP